jgi:hypothetical protein
MLTFYEFTEEDLKSNRNGFITPRQKEWVKGFAKGISGMQRGNAKIAIIFPFIGLCLILGMNLSNERARAAFLSDPTYLIVLLLVVPLWLVFLPSAFILPTAAPPAFQKLC